MGTPLLYIKCQQCRVGHCNRCVVTFEFNGIISLSTKNGLERRRSVDCWPTLRIIHSDTVGYRDTESFSKLCPCLLS